VCGYYYTAAASVFLGASVCLWSPFIFVTQPRDCCRRSFDRDVSGRRSPTASTSDPPDDSKYLTREWFSGNISLTTEHFFEITFSTSIARLYLRKTLQIFQLSLTMTTLCHVKRDHLLIFHLPEISGVKFFDAHYTENVYWISQQ